MTLRVEGRSLRARNEGHEDHTVWLEFGDGRNRRTELRTLAPGEEMTRDLPMAEAAVTGYDLTDHMKLALSGARR